MSVCVCKTLGRIDSSASLHYRAGFRGTRRRLHSCTTRRGRARTPRRTCTSRRSTWRASWRGSRRCVLFCDGPWFCVQSSLLCIFESSCLLDMHGAHKEQSTQRIVDVCGRARVLFWERNGEAMSAVSSSRCCLFDMYLAYYNCAQYCAAHLSPCVCLCKTGMNNITVMTLAGASGARASAGAGKCGSRAAAAAAGVLPGGRRQHCIALVQRPCIGGLAQCGVARVQ